MDGLHKIVVGDDVPMRGGSLRIDGVTWGHTPGEDPYKISFSNDYSKLDGVKFVPGFLAPLQITYNGQHVYLESQRSEATPLNYDSLGPLAHLTNQQLWNQYRLAIGGRLAPASAHADVDIAGALVDDQDVPFEEPQLQLRTDFPYGWVAGTPIHVTSPKDATGFVAHAIFGDKEYTSGPLDLSAGWNVIPFTVGGTVRGIVVFRDADKH